MYLHFEEMVKKLSPTLHRITHRLNGHFTFFDDDDLYQEALEHMWVLFENGSLGDKTDSYILQGCFFHLKNYIRKTMDRAKLMSLSESIDSGGATIEDTLTDHSLSTRDSIDKELLEENATLKSLTEREWTVLRLATEGLTVRQIGEKIGISHVMVVKIRAHIKEKCAPLKNILLGGYHN